MAKIPGKFNLSFVLRVAIFFLFCGFFFFVLSRHLPWRDEYQTFLVATRTHSWSEFWEATRYERTPPLHYLIQKALWPILGDFLSPRTFIRIVTVPFSLLTFWLLFFRFRFEIGIAFLVSGSVFFFREWGVISRSYVIGGALLLLSLDLRNRGKPMLARVIVALSSASHFLFYLIAGGVLAIDYFLDFRGKGFRRRGFQFWTLLAFVIGIGGIVSVHQLITPPGAQFTANLTIPSPMKLGSNFLRELGVLLFPIEMQNADGDWTWVWSWNESPIRFAWGFLFIIPFFFSFRKSKELALQFSIVSLPVFTLFLFVYGPALRHLGVLFLILVYFIAQIKPEKRSRWAISILVSGPFIATLFWIQDWNPFYPNYIFSDSTNLKPLLDEKVTLYTNHDYLLFPAMAESGREVFDLEKNTLARYPYFRWPDHGSSISEVCSNPLKQPFHPGDLIFLSQDDSFSHFIIMMKCGNWKLAYETSFRVATDERFKVFRYQGERAP